MAKDENYVFFFFLCTKYDLVPYSSILHVLKNLRR